jgi:tetratricopeptide (TPR) repeat protein
MASRILRFPNRPISSELGHLSARRILETGFDQRLRRETELHLEDPETLLALCGELRSLMDTTPARVRDEAEFLYRFVAVPKRPIGLFDEREYFLGETAAIAGTACRHLSRRDEARVWFDRAEAGFRHTMNVAAELARLGYQRLALRLEERQLEVVIEMAPSLRESFEQLDMAEDALKCRFLEGLALMESDKPAEAVAVFRHTCREAEALQSEKLLALAYTNLTQLHGMLGESVRAVEASRKAVPVLRRLNDRVGLAKVQWGLAMMLREQRDLVGAIETYRAAQAEFSHLGMRADVAALHLVVADLLLDLRKDSEAQAEILAALPVIDELKMVPEGLAALTLLKESLRQSSINRQALRDLHGFFEELSR